MRNAGAFRRRIAVLSVGAALLLPSSIAMPAKPAADRVARWRMVPISSDAYESHAAIDPLTGEFWFVRSARDFTGWRLMVSHCADSRSLVPVAPPFAGQGLEADPSFSPDGSFLYFISTRAAGSMKGRDLDIWRVHRDHRLKWSKPERLPPPVNSDEAEWFPRQSSDGWLYFGSNRSGGQGGNDIWRAQQGSDGNWSAENAGPNINSAQDEYEALPSPDARTMIIEARDGYYVSRLKQGAWSKRERLGPQINANGSEIGATFSPSGKSILFSRDIGAPASGEFFLWHFAGQELWPVICQRKPK